MIGYTVNEDTMTVMLKGEIDHHSTAGIRTEIDELINKYRPTSLIMNFQEITFCDSSGIAIVLGRYKLMNRLGGSVTLTGLNKATEKIFTLAKLDSMVKIEKQEKYKNEANK
ncbi:MAG: anti-sigma factor antagonist [Eubacteriales bacterium]